MARSLARAIDRALELVRAEGAGSPSYLNVAITDGEHAVVSRFTDDPDAAPESLYHYDGPLYAPLPDQPAGAARYSVTVSSERLTADAGWTEVPAGQIIVLRRNREPQYVDAVSGKLHTAA
jgi:predicted glutamine amidotransferase